MDIMRPPLEFLMPPQMGAELIYSFVIVVCSLMIYYATKEVYELSSYKWIRYFRQAFLFFSLAYFFRYSIKFFLVLFNMKEILDISPRYVGWISLFVFLGGIMWLFRNRDEIISPKGGGEK